MQRWECPRCPSGKTIVYVKVGFGTRDIGAEQFIHNHIQRHREISRQTTLLGNDVTDSEEVRMSMKISKEILTGMGNFLKPTQMGYSTTDIGKRERFTVTGDVVQNGNLYSVAVKHSKGEGSYALNRTSLKVLGLALGDDTTTWAGSSFESMIVPQRNPQTNQQVLSWTIIAETVKKK